MREKTKTYSALAILLVSLFLTASLAGCGYSMVGRRGFVATNVSIGPIENKTPEPGLEEYLYFALSDELMKQGIDVDQNSPNRIYGTLNIFQFQGVAENNQVFTSYQLTISGRFVFKGAGGGKIVLAGASPFIISFSAQGDLNDVFAQRQEAIKTGMQSFASQMVAGLLNTVSPK
ncbi:MAG: LPS assembly lipoprotein LptE [Nitrospiraceae bacterium]|nr:LPS assembly lipoprotein LptE [Nitrospiraceae bacterium]